MRLQAYPTVRLYLACSLQQLVQEGVLLTLLLAAANGLQDSCAAIERLLWRASTVHTSAMPQSALQLPPNTRDVSAARKHARAPILCTKAAGRPRPSLATP